MNRKSTPDKPKVDPSVKAVEKVDKDMIEDIKQFRDLSYDFWSNVARELEQLKSRN